MNWTFGLIASVVLLSPVRGQELCPVEVKILLSSPEAQPVIAALGFKKRTEGRVYFFDTKSLDLLTQGVIVRIRQGANNDLTVKLRPPKGNPADERSQLRNRFPCEIDRMRAEADTSYAVLRQYKVVKVPEIGIDVYSQLSESQQKLLIDAGVSIDWDRIIRIASIHSTRWKTGAQSTYGKLALELWEWPAGRILELSEKAPPATDASKYAELERLLTMKGLSLNASQDTKTSLVLRSVADHTSPLR